MGFTLRLDPPGALLLACAALLWIVVSAALWRDRQPDDRFGLCWLLTMIGNIGVFIAGDLVSFYLFYALVSIPAYGLFAFSDDSEQKRAGRDLYGLHHSWRGASAARLRNARDRRAAWKRAHRRCDGRVARLTLAETRRWV